MRTHQLTLALMRQSSAADTLRAMVAVLGEDFHGEQVRVLLHAPVDVTIGQQLIDLKNAHTRGALSVREYDEQRRKLIEAVK